MVLRSGLEQLQANARVTNVELAREIHLTPSPCFNRVRALEESGVIRRHVTLLDTERLGLRLNVFIQVSLEKQREESLHKFEETIASRPGVMECYLMTGDSDSSIALKQVRYKTAVPLPPDGLVLQDELPRATLRKPRKQRSR